MSVPSVQTIELNQERAYSYDAGEALALVDVETYPAFVGKDVDRFDMMAHLSSQMQALTALSWKAPDEAHRLRLVVTESDSMIDRISHSNPAQIASGNLRTYGQVCLATHEHLFDCARHRTHDLLRAPRSSKLPPPRLINIPPGVYAISIYYHTPFTVRNGAASKSKADAKIDYSVILRHYAFPPPRPAPIRLSPGIIPYVGEEAAASAWGGRNSHKSPV